MNLDDFLFVAYTECIKFDEDSAMYYLSPTYMVDLSRTGLTIEDIDDAKITMNDLREMLMLETKRRNLKADKTYQVMDWVHAIISEKIDPVMVSEENELFKHIMDYMQLSSALKEKESDLKDREEVLSKKEDFKITGPIAMNFSKKVSE